MDVMVFFVDEFLGVLLLVFAVLVISWCTGMVAKWYVRRRIGGMAARSGYSVKIILHNSHLDIEVFGAEVSNITLWVCVVAGAMMMFAINAYHLRHRGYTPDMMVMWSVGWLAFFSAIACFIIGICALRNRWRDLMVRLEHSSPTIKKT